MHKTVFDFFAGRLRGASSGSGLDTEAGHRAFVVALKPEAMSWIEGSMSAYAWRNRVHHALLAGNGREAADVRELAEVAGWVPFGSSATARVRRRRRWTSPAAQTPR